MRNPRYANPHQIGILLDYDTDGLPSLYVDSGPLYDAVLAGEFGPIADYSPPEPDPDPRTLDEVKAAKLARIRAARKAVEDGGMMRDPLGIMFDSDERARAKYSETARVFGLMPDLEIEGWKASDGPDGLGVYVTMTQALLDALTLAGAQHDQTCFAWERARQAEVAAAQTVEEVAAVSEAMS